MFKRFWNAFNGSLTICLRVNLVLHVSSARAYYESGSWLHGCSAIMGLNLVPEREASCELQSFYG